MITLQNLLFDIPIWLLGMLAIVGIALIVSGNRQQHKGFTRAGMAVLALGVLLMVLSYFIDTDQEKVIKRTRQLVHAVEVRDTATMTALLHPDVTLYAWKKADIIERSRALADRANLTEARVNSTDAIQPDRDLISVSLSVAAHFKDAFYDNIPTAWDLSWVRTPSGWLLRDIRVKPAGPGGIDAQLRDIFEQGN